MFFGLGGPYELAAPSFHASAQMVKVTGHRSRSAPVLPSIERRNRYVPLQRVHADSDAAPLQSQPDAARTGEWVAAQPDLASLSMISPIGGLQNIAEGAEGSQTPSAHSRTASQGPLTYSRQASGLSQVHGTDDALRAGPSQGLVEEQQALLDLPRPVGDRQRSVFEVASVDTPKADAQHSRHASSRGEIDTQPSLVTAVATTGAGASTIRSGAPPARPTRLDPSKSFKMVRDQLHRAAYEQRYARDYSRS